MRHRVLILLLSALVLAPCTRATADDTPYPSAQVCKNCHARIYDEWQSSWMARAFSNDNFQRQYQRWRAMMEQGKEYFQAHPEQRPGNCLRCHSPLADIAGDYARPSQEGVTCVVCHKMRQLHEVSGNYTPEFETEDIVYGASGRTIDLPAHRVRPSQALASAEVCSACHHDILPTGLRLERTYEEWKTSPYAAAGVRCQDCHMPQTAGAPAAGKGINTSTSTHRSHRFPGGHRDSPLMKGAARLTVLPGSNRTRLNVQVTNLAAGHNLPTGGAHPNKLILAVTVTNHAGAIIHTDQRVYQYNYLDERGRPVEPAQLRDTTLAPQTPRTEIFELPALTGARKANITLTFQLAPTSLATQLDASIYQRSYAPLILDKHTLDLTQLP